MLAIGQDSLIPFRDVPRYLPRRPNGRPVHLSAIYRWAAKGCKASDANGTRVILEAIRIGGTTYTSIEAIQRFADALTGRRDESATPINRLSRSRQAQARNAAEQVRQQLGIKTEFQNPAAKGCTPDAPSVQPEHARKCITERRLTGKREVDRQGN